MGAQLLSSFNTQGLAVSFWWYKRGCRTVKQKNKMNWKAHSSLTTSLHFSDTFCLLPSPLLKCTLTAGRGKIHVGCQELGTVWHFHIRKLTVTAIACWCLIPGLPHMARYRRGGSVPWRPEWWEIQIPNENAGDVSQTWARPKLLCTTHHLSNSCFTMVRESLQLLY